jgi:hypothetical protein
VAASGGEIALDRNEGGRARVLWRPRPLDVSIVRQGMLLAGTEVFHLAIEVDARTGALLGGRSECDDLDLRVHAPFSGSEAPARDRWPRTGGFPVRIRRTLVLEPLP